MFNEFSELNGYQLLFHSESNSYDFFLQDRQILRAEVALGSRHYTVQIKCPLMTGLTLAYRPFVDTICRDYGSILATKGFELGMDDDTLFLVRPLTVKRRQQSKIHNSIFAGMHSVTQHALDLEPELADRLDWIMKIKLN